MPLQLRSDYRSSASVSTAEQLWYKQSELRRALAIVRSGRAAYSSKKLHCITALEHGGRQTDMNISSQLTADHYTYIGDAAKPQNRPTLCDLILSFEGASRKLHEQDDGWNFKRFSEKHFLDAVRMLFGFFTFIIPLFSRCFTKRLASILALTAHMIQLHRRARAYGKTFAFLSLQKSGLSYNTGRLYESHGCFSE